MYRAILHSIYLQGYKGRLYPRFLRYFLRKTRLHQSWLAGYMGIYKEGSTRFGVCDRANFRYRHHQRRLV